MSTDQVDRFKFGGHDLTDDLWVNPTRSLGLPVENVSVKVPGRPGERFVRSELQPLDIPVHVRLRSLKTNYEDVAKQRRKISSILVTDEPQPLVLPDEPTLYYLAKLEEPGELDTLWHTGAADLTFRAYDPIAYGPERETEVEAGTPMVFVEGTYETRPAFALTSDGGKVSIADEEGNVVELEAEVEAGKPVVIDMDARTATVDGEAVPLVLGSAYWPLNPGRNDLTLTGAHGTVAWQERWV